MARRLPAPGRLVLATHNAGKLREIAALLPGYDVVSAGSLDLAEPVEDAPDFVGNARIKALHAATAARMPALADDSGFCVAALRGAPGVHSARWAGDARDFGAAMARVWQEAEGGDMRAWFVCALCLAWPDGHADSFVGRAAGTLAWPPRGARGFGYDPVFVPAGGRLTYGEMEPDAKHAMSHRARAMEQMRAACLR